MFAENFYLLGEVYLAVPSLGEKLPDGATSGQGVLAFCSLKLYSLVSRSESWLMNESSISDFLLDFVCSMFRNSVVCLVF